MVIATSQVQVHSATPGLEGEDVVTPTESAIMRICGIICSPASGEVGWDGTSADVVAGRQGAATPVGGYDEMATASRPLEGDVTCRPLEGDVTCRPPLTDVTCQPPLTDVTCRPLEGDVTCRPPLTDDVVDHQFVNSSGADEDISPTIL